MSRLRLGIAIAGVILLSSAPVLAAQVDGPRFLSSDPQAGEELNDAPPESVEITFSEPLDASSEIKVIDECENRIDDGSTTINANSMQVGFKKTPVGTYTVFYSAVGPGGITGETNGSFQFLVHVGKSCGGGEHGSNHGGSNHGGEKPGHGGSGHEGEYEGGHGGSGEHEGGGSDHEGSSHSGGSTHSGSGTASHSSSQTHSGGSSSGSHSGGSTHNSSTGTSDHGASGDHSSTGSKHGSEHGSKVTSKHGSGHGSGDRVKGTTLAAPGGPAGEALLGQVEGSAVLMALGAALLMGVGGGWVIRTKGLL